MWRLRFIYGCVLANFFVLPSIVVAQNIELENANTYYQSSLYKEAIPLFESVLERGVGTAQTKQRLAECYWFVNNPAKSVFWYGQIIDQPEFKKYLLDYAKALKMNRQYDDARQYALRYAQQVDSAKGYHFANTCDYAKEQIANSTPIFRTENLEKINSKNADFAPTFYKDQLFFASSRSVAVEKNGAVNWTNDAFNQYYQAVRDATMDSFTNAKPLRNYIAKDINDAPMAYNKNGDVVAITSNNFMDGIRPIDGSGLMMDIYLYEAMSMREWKSGTESFFQYNATVDAEAPYSTGHPYLVGRGDAMYFSSNRPGGLGGYDLYVCYKTSRGWTLPKNLGHPVNTPGNEMSPFVDETGRLFFSSDWHAGFGGMDIFTAERLPFAWLNIQNLGLGVNSSGDDMYFIYDSNKRVGYFSSNRSGGKGNEDIYRATQTGYFPPRPRMQAEVGIQYALRNVQFNEGTELVFSDKELQNMFSLMLMLTDNPDLVIQVFAYTDAKGGTNNNLESSQKRAKMVADYLINNGISNTRIQYAGLGEYFPLNHCKEGTTCTETEHWVNRRVEITVAGRMDESNNVIITHDATPDMRRVSRYGTVAFKRTPKSKTRYTTPNNPVPYIPPFPNQIRTGSLAVSPSLGDVGTPVLTKTVENSKIEPNSNPNINPNTNPNTNPTANKTTPKDYLKEYPEKAPRKPVRKEHYAVGDAVDIANIYYEHNKSSIDEKNSPGLKEVLEVLTEQPRITMEIGSHTDANGDAGYNLELSRKRAEAVKSYLIKKGIAEDRLTAKGYGESQLLNKCKDGVKCSDEEHAANRRTEFKVTGHTGFKVGDVINIESIFYELEQATLDLKKSKGLQEILQILKENQLSVEIRSHTDSRGTSKYNQELSEKRAKSVYDYLVKNGVSKTRLKYKGYGETMPLNKCKDDVKCSEQEHAINRRTDFKIIGLR